MSVAAQPDPEELRIGDTVEIVYNPPRVWSDHTPRSGQRGTIFLTDPDYRGGMYAVQFPDEWLGVGPERSKYTPIIRFYRQEVRKVGGS